MRVLEPAEWWPSSIYVGRDTARARRDCSGDTSGDSDAEEMTREDQQTEHNELRAWRWTITSTPTSSVCAIALDCFSPVLRQAYTYERECFDLTVDLGS
jgi:hypothetical protein